jgi:hypothetical protein
MVTKALKYNLVITLLFLILESLSAGLQFSNRGGSIFIMPSGRLYLGETDSIQGWSRESIVQTAGNDAPRKWDPSWVGPTNVLYQQAPVQDLPENPGDITLQTYYYELKNNLALGPNRHLIIKSTPDTNYTYIQGNGYQISLAEGFQNLFQVDPGHRVDIENVVFINYDENSLYLPAGSSLYFLNSTIEFTDNRTLTLPLNLAGTVVINGYGYTLSFDPGGSLNITSGFLSINNQVLFGLANSNLRCTNQSSTMFLQNCDLVLTDTYVFRDGGLITQNSKISGFNTFSYESAQTFTVNRQLLLDSGVTFSYSPIVAKNNLIELASDSSIYMNGSTLKTTTTGLQLTKGTLIIDNQNQMYNDGATSLSEAIWWGNGNAADNLKIEILPGANLDLMSGILVYNNTD